MGLGTQPTTLAAQRVHDELCNYLASKGLELAQLALERKLLPPIAEYSPIRPPKRRYELTSQNICLIVQYQRAYLGYQITSFELQDAKDGSTISLKVDFRNDDQDVSRLDLSDGKALKIGISNRVVEKKGNAKAGDLERTPFQASVSPDDLARNDALMEKQLRVMTEKIRSVLLAVVETFGSPEEPKGQA